MPGSYQRDQLQTARVGADRPPPEQTIATTTVFERNRAGCWAYLKCRKRCARHHPRRGFVRQRFEGPEVLIDLRREQTGVERSAALVHPHHPAISRGEQHARSVGGCPAPRVVGCVCEDFRHVDHADTCRPHLPRAHPIGSPSIIRAGHARSATVNTGFANP